MRSGHQRWTNSRSLTTLLALTITAIATACGHGGIDHLDRDSSAEQLNTAFSYCPWPDAETFELSSFLASPVGWLQVVEVQSPSEMLEKRDDLPVIDVIANQPGSDRQIHKVQAYWAQWPGVLWALENGGTAWAALGDPDMTGMESAIIYFLTFTEAGTLFMPGGCGDTTLYPTMLDLFGDRINDKAAEMVGLTGSDLREHLGIPDHVPDPADRPTILNPETVPESLLRSLQFAMLDVTVSRDLGDEYTICTKVSEGWNDCFVPDQWAVDVGHLIDAYIPSDGVLEVWLLDTNADLTRPIRRLGVVVVDLALRQHPEIALRIHIDASIDGESTVEALEQIPVDRLEERGDVWSALERIGTAVPATPGNE